MSIDARAVAAAATALASGGPTPDGARALLASLETTWRKARTAKLRQELADLGLPPARNGAAKASATLAPVKRAGLRRRPPTATPALVRARKLQGKYLGRLKRLAGRNRQRVKATARDKSVAAAVALADKLLRR